jgi:predicted component of type VI protein secretion system
MHRIALVCVGLIAAAIFVPRQGVAWAQDIAGTEDCTKTSGLDKRTGCLQSNVNFLQQLVTKNALDARQRLNAANGEVAALKAEIIALKSTVASLQASVQQLQAAQKAAADKKLDAKPETNKPETKKSDAK